jgi:hypothetical protein
MHARPERAPAEHPLKLGVPLYVSGLILWRSAVCRVGEHFAAREGYS